MTEFERGVDDGLLRSLGIVTSTPDQTALGCAKAIREEMERRRLVPAAPEAAATPRTDAVAWEPYDSSAREAFRKLCKQLERELAVANAGNKGLKASLHSTQDLLAASERRWQEDIRLLQDETTPYSKWMKTAKPEER